MGGATLALGVLLAAPAGAQVPDVEALRERVPEHAHSLAEEDGRLAGPALEVLLEAAEGSLFLALGELVPGSREVPRIAGHLFRELQAAQGYQYLAAGGDPFFLDRLQAPGFRGDLERMAALVARHPMSLATATYEELALLAEVMRESRARGRPVWGLQLPTGALHLLDPLVEHAADEGVAGRILELREEAAAVEGLRFGPLPDPDDAEVLAPEEVEPPPDVALAAALADEADFLARQGDEALFRELRDAYGPLPGSPEARWFEALILAARAHRTDDEADRAEVERAVEGWVRDRFLEQYREAEARGEREPRVLLKLAEPRLGRGLGQAGALTLGTLLAELAYARGSHSVHVLVLPLLPEGHPEAAIPEALEPLVAGAPAAGWTLVDLRAMRADPAAAGLRRSARDVHDLLVGWDFLLVLPDATPGDPTDLLRAAGVVEPDEPEDPEAPREAPPTDRSPAR